jgi:hypothetical protein
MSTPFTSQGRRPSTPFAYQCPTSGPMPPSESSHTHGTPMERVKSFHSRYHHANTSSNRSGEMKGPEPPQQSSHTNDASKRTSPAIFA